MVAARLVAFIIIIIIIIIISDLIGAVSPVMRIQSEVKCHCCLNTETTHNSYAACGRKDNIKTAQKPGTQGTMTSHHFGQKSKS
jgi:hypothetical protein